MMYKLSHTNKNVQYYYVNEQMLHYSDHLYYNFKKISGENIIGGSLLDHNHIIVNKEERQLIIDTNLITIQEFSNDIILFDTFIKTPTNRIASVNTIFNDDGSIVCNWVLFNYTTNKVIQDFRIKTSYCVPVYINENIIVFQDMNKLTSYNIQNGTVLWEFSDESLASHILGTFNNEIILPTTANSILTLNAHTGVKEKEWKEIPKINIGSQIEGVIPEPSSFVLDIENKKLIGAIGTNYIEIELDTNKIKHIDLIEELQKSNIFFIKQITDNPFTETHLFLTAMMEQNKNDEKWSYDCLFALNRKTFKIDWKYNFETQNLGTHTPKASKNHLYQLDNDGTLFVFEKQLENTSV
ncbi:hypothetical protein [Aquimarina macrocephali]|uniref:hypothetical protein n=1 Tax=Aquimarina macrocephali TaxID=666563 RepID=UPI0004638652|nr:hypothetical protein [Aquimarina macrocephali]